MTSFGGIFDLPAKEQRLAQLDIELAAPAFWDDNRRAQELIRERTEVARTVDRVGQLAAQASDLGVLLELAQEAGDDG
ncbi:MAG: PCRF domain-containing protein, partial [Candidatus Rokuibacteriota bacterium]